MDNVLDNIKVDLDDLYEKAKDDLCVKNDGYRLNFGVYYTPKF